MAGESLGCSLAMSHRRVIAMKALVSSTSGEDGEKEICIHSSKVIHLKRIWLLIVFLICKVTGLDM
jgi:hypothetical protein